MKKRNLAKMVAVAAVSTMFVGVNVSATANPNFCDTYAVMACSYNEYTPTVAKITTEAHVGAEVNSLTNVSKVRVWAINDKHEQISDDYIFKAGNYASMKFTKSGYNKKKKKVGAGLDNPKYQPFTKGKVNMTVWTK